MTETKNTWERATCEAEGCSRKASGFLMGTRCNFHTALHNARELSPEDLAALREAMESVVSITDEERQEREAKARLWSVTYSAQSLDRDIKRAREAGVSEERIESAKRERKPISEAWSERTK